MSRVPRVRTTDCSDSDRADGAQALSEICGQSSDLGIHAAARLRIGYHSYMCSDSSGDAVTDLGRALDEVAGQDLKGMFGPQVLDRTRSLLTLKNRVDAELARTVRGGRAHPGV